MSPPPPDRAGGSTHTVVSGSPRGWCGARACMRSFVRSWDVTNAQVQTRHAYILPCRRSRRKEKASQTNPARSSDQRQQQQEGAKRPPEIPHSIFFPFPPIHNVSPQRPSHPDLCARLVWLVKQAPARWTSDQPALLLSRRALGACSDLPGVIPTGREPSLTHSDNAQPSKQHTHSLHVRTHTHTHARRCA